MRILHFLLFFIPFYVNATLKIDINRGSVSKINILIGKCGKNLPDANPIIKVIKSDLGSSGLFNIKEVSSIKCDDEASLENFSNIENGSMLLTISSVKKDKSDFELKYRLIDASLKKQLIGKSITSSSINYRRVAHVVSDSIYTQTTGDKGYFNTSIAHIADINNTKRIAIMDQDGANVRFITDGRFLVLTPRFSSDGSKMAYMSYEKKQGKVYIKDLVRNKSEIVGDFSGVMSAPSFTPDGKSVIMARSIHDVTDIYRVDLKNNQKRKLTVRSAINTSPSYSPDQKKIIFNSDRSGSAQIYVMNTDGSNQKRISSGEGSYRTPVWSPRGDLIAFTKIYKRSFYIGVMKTDGTSERIIATGHLVEGPSWSPNGRLLIFTKEERSYNGQKPVSKIYSIDITGKNEKLIKTQYNASGPAWSSLMYN